MDHATVEKDQPLTPAGRLFLDPQVNQVVNFAVAFEHPIDIDSFKIVVKNSIMLRRLRFCSLMVKDSCGREHWRKTSVDLDHHLIMHRQPLFEDSSISDEDVVNDYMADLSVSTPLPTDKPLWEIHLLLAHKTAVFRVHHALGDGISLMSMLQSFSTQPRVINGGVGCMTLGRCSSSSSRIISVWMLMKSMWYTFVFAVEFALRFMCIKDKTTVISGGYGVELWPRSLATAKFRLDDMTVVKRAVGNATINDVLLGVISNGLSRYLDIRSSTALKEGTQITGVAMVNLRPQAGLMQEISDGNSESWWGNKFGMILFPVYYNNKSRDGSSDPLQIVRRAKSIMDKKKLSLEASLSYKAVAFGVSYFGPKLATILNDRMFCNTTFTISNITGPRDVITFADNTVKTIRLTTSCVPHAITMHMVSYAGVAEMQILVAKDIIPDPKVLANCFEDALLQMKQAAESVRTSY